MRDTTHAELRWFFQDSSFDCEIPFLLGALDLTGDLLDTPDDAFRVAPITKCRRIRSHLLEIGQHADVLACAFEVRDWPARILTLFSWPGVAVHTIAAQLAVALASIESGARTTDGQVTQSEPWPGRAPLGYRVNEYGESTQTHPHDAPPPRTGRLMRLPLGDFHRSTRPRATPDGALAYLCGLKARSPVHEAIRAETAQRVSEATRAYESVRRVSGRRAA
jgi:hypothetical protein